MNVLSRFKRSKPKPTVRTGGWLFELKIFEWLRYGITALVALFVKLWCATLRIEASDASRDVICNAPAPSAFIVWHNNLFLAAYWAKFRPKGRVYALISAGAIGAWISPFFERFNVKSIRGSVNLRAKQALKEMVLKVEEGDDVTVTPDGSRGPCYDFKPGTSMIVKKTNCGVIMLACKFHNAWRLKTWDRFYIPKPFSRVECEFRYFSSYKELTDSNKLSDITEALRAQMMGMTDDSSFKDTKKPTLAE